MDPGRRSTSASTAASTAGAPATLAGLAPGATRVCLTYANAIRLLPLEVMPTSSLPRCRPGNSARGQLADHCPNPG